MHGYSDSDWAVRHSTSGYTFRYSTATISWSSKKQATVSLSSCEAEIVAASEASREAVHLDNLFGDLGLIPPESKPPVMRVDNQSAIAVAYNPVTILTIQSVIAR